MQIELHTRRAGYDRPMKQPKQSIEAAAEGLGFAALNDLRMREVAVVRKTRVTRQVGGQEFTHTHEAALITFTRTGPQEFANRKGFAWWDDPRDAKAAA